MAPDERLPVGEERIPGRPDAVRAIGPGRGLEARVDDAAEDPKRVYVTPLGTPGGFALGNATGDCGWTYWLVWAFGGKLVDENNNVVINSPETIKALEYMQELYPTFVPGTLAWLDPNNNKAFLDDQVSVTNNGISIYYAAKNSNDPKLKAMAEDIYHSPLPIG